MTTSVHYERSGPVAVLTIDNPPVNASNLRVRSGLQLALERAAADRGVRVIVITGAGPHFVAGSDLSEFDGPVPAPELPTVLDIIERCSVPVVAALHGVALGGGLELALATDGRIATPDTVVGLPEVTLGMLPGAGGTQRLPRLIGRVAAVDMVCSGRRVDAAEAERLGIIDHVVAAGELISTATAFGLGLGGRRRLSERPLPSEPVEAIAEAVALATAARNEPQVRRAAELVATERAFAEGIVLERAAFTELRLSDRAARMRRSFFLERRRAALRSIRARERPGSVVLVAPAGLTSAAETEAALSGAGIGVCRQETGAGAILSGRDDPHTPVLLWVRSGEDEPHVQPVVDALPRNQTIVCVLDRTPPWKVIEAPANVVRVVLAGGIAEIIAAPSTAPCAAEQARTLWALAGRIPVTSRLAAGSATARLANAARQSAAGSDNQRTLLACAAAQLFAEEAVESSDDIDLLITDGLGLATDSLGIVHWVRRQSPAELSARLTRLGLGEEEISTVLKFAEPSRSPAL